MTDNQRAKNVFNLMYKGELPEKTIQEQIESEGKLRLEKASSIYDEWDIKHLKIGFDNCVAFAVPLFEAELSSKDKLIETTNNNLLAALEEVKRLKELVKDNWMQYFGRQYVFTSHRDRMWKKFCKENNIEL